MKARWMFCVAAMLAMGTAISAEDEQRAGGHAEENPLVVDKATREKLGIATERITMQTLTEELRAPGEVKANAYATTLVSPRVPAQIVARRAKLGDEVKAGQPLVILSSTEVAEAQGTLIVAEREWQRVRKLGADAVSARRYSEAEVARDQARAKLRAFGIADGEIARLMKRGSGSADGEFALVAPQSGRVTADEFLVGERVEPGRALFTLVDERRVWVEAQLPPDAAGRVKVGTLARVVAHGHELAGEVVQLAHRAQESSRTTPVRVEVANENDVLHAGEFIETYIATTVRSEALAVPNEAIVQLQGQSTIFKQAQGGDRFEPVAIETGGTRGASTIVTRGIASGDIVVVSGAFELKARLLKSQLGEGHGH